MRFERVDFAVLYVGGNDLESNMDPQEICDNIKALINEMAPVVLVFKELPRCVEHADAEQKMQNRRLLNRKLTATLKRMPCLRNLNPEDKRKCTRSKKLPCNYALLSSDEQMNNAACRQDVKDMQIRHTEDYVTSFLCCFCSLMAFGSDMLNVTLHAPLVFVVQSSQADVHSDAQGGVVHHPYPARVVALSFPRMAHRIAGDVEKSVYLILRRNSCCHVLCPTEQRLLATQASVMQHGLPVLQCRDIEVLMLDHHLHTVVLRPWCCIAALHLHILCQLLAWTHLLCLFFQK
ncbi:uncharacterized protein LOC142589226 isoform X1 [Dermacentor variabilis]|uniref:uncharacterized protein LOC142589226 isoform X1 n=1 Tax=Dermacentor variabilis TaxID=34621 RepID=UPI003F5B55F7